MGFKWPVERFLWNGLPYHRIGVEGASGLTAIHLNTYTKFIFLYPPPFRMVSRVLWESTKLPRSSVNGLTTQGRSPTAHARCMKKRTSPFSKRRLLPFICIPSLYPPRMQRLTTSVFAHLLHHVTQRGTKKEKPKLMLATGTASQ